MATAVPFQEPAFRWRQIIVGFTDYASAENITSTELQPMMEAVTESWWFTRKAPHWRMRYLPLDPAGHDSVREGVEALKANGRVSSSTETIYEPELHAFGGPEAMTTAHQLFCQDSHQILAQPTHLRAHRREHTILLCSAFLRAAGQDWYEQGDVWSRVATNRPVTSPIPTVRAEGLATGLRRLMTVDAGPRSPLTTPTGQLAGIATWINSFHDAGAALGDLNLRGDLGRGLRDVLAHHVLFHWNRLGLPYDTQSTLAHAARQAVFDQP
ncbi:thiopeptide-type bacteriocin biosynthesis protein [Kribbella catacumbae]|uniref:thiopeptide-type bacteriocin biosynthesis protein n=1 Tax=Kribbella catacumbae TaxID=460086 RepID=UPI000376A9D4|nr:thiopeptide-type bacteriocin biosynthesis protein [Kribbella catacumbae]